MDNYNEYINDDKHSDFASLFLERYFSRGFGSMTKNDIEVMIFDLMTRYGSISTQSNFDISCLLKIPEAKVKRLRYEASIRYGNHDVNKFKEDFYIIISKAEYIADKDNIKFSVEDKFIRMRIHSELKKLNAFADIGNNSEIIVVDKELFGKLLNKLYIEENAKLFEEKINDVVNNQYDNRKGFCENFKNIVTTIESFRHVISTIGFVLAGLN